MDCCFRFHRFFLGGGVRCLVAYLYIGFFTAFFFKVLLSDNFYMSVPLLVMFCPYGYSHVFGVHFYLVAYSPCYLGCTHFYYVGLLYALLGVQLGLLYLVCMFL